VFKRVRWMGFGAVAGVGATMWARQRMRRTVQRYLPAQVSNEVAARARAIGGELRGAFDDGRQAMAAKEAQLRAQIEQGRGGLRPHPAGGRAALHLVEATAEPVERVAGPPSPPPPTTGQSPPSPEPPGGSSGTAPPPAPGSRRQSRVRRPGRG
jgi:hypothetical protein